MPKKLIGVFLGWILIAGVSTALAQKPLMQGQVDTLIAGGAKSQQVIKLIQARGIGFTLSREYLENLQLKGVDKRVIAALCVAATGPLSKDQLIVLLKSGTPDKSLAELVEKRHLSFKPSDDDLAQFFGLGAGDQLDIALQNSKLVVATLANGKLEPKPAGAAPPGVTGPPSPPPSKLRLTLPSIRSITPALTSRER